mmetsp:Transcript_8589/g.14501  ORF Transcript_8589/g.14501 Transcript_8589/m.14501 type:complete len:162 (+) Transcript_8589:786-1271(+)
MEKQIQYGLRVEFGVKQIKNTNDVLYEMDQPGNFNKLVGTINSKLLVSEFQAKGQPGQQDDPLLSIMRNKFKKSFTSLVFVHDTLHPKEVFLALREYLQPSGSFALFSTVLQPLSELLYEIQHISVNARIDELWTREQQVLPLRTHPTMSTDGRSGYILSG